MDLNVFDYILAALIVFGLPVYGAWGYGRLKRRIAAGVVDARISEYKSTIVTEWMLSLVVLVLWVAASRAFPDLGLGLGAGWGAWAGAGLTLVVCGLLVYQTVTALRDPKKVETLRDQHAHLTDLIPQNEREARWWTPLSVTAGICEELIYRGFLIAIFAAIFNIWAAVVLSSIAFGIAHMYQGAMGIVKTGVTGLVLAGLFVLTGTLWVPIVLHVVIDLNSGYLARRVFATPAPEPASTGA